jgi:hypothetical protein
MMSHALLVAVLMAAGLMQHILVDTAQSLGAEHEQRLEAVPYFAVTCSAVASAAVQQQCCCC